MNTRVHVNTGAYMRIINETKWSTDDLRTIFQKALTHNVLQEGPFPSKRLRVKVNSSKYSNYSGHAYVNSGRMTISIPARGNSALELNPFKIAHVFQHEMMHCRGISGHRNMGSFYTDWDRANEVDHAYAKGLCVRMQQEKPKPPKNDIQITRYERVLAKYAKWQVKRKNAALLEQKYKGQVQYYEKVLAADGRLAAWKGHK